MTVHTVPTSVAPSHCLEMATSTFADRPLRTLVLFDVDGTLTPARQVSRLPFQPAIHHLSPLTVRFCRDDHPIEGTQKKSRDWLCRWL
jgi:hypothetical protein